MSTRADNFTQTKKIPDLFSDFLDDLTPHPITKDLVRVKNDQAIKQSIKNIVFTRLGERLFQPTIGSEIANALFEPNDIILEENLKFTIRSAIAFHEPRASVISVDIFSYSEEDRIAVNIFFSIINSTTVQNLNLILRRVR
jgi:phage baseplate assembly protein W